METIKHSLDFCEMELHPKFMILEVGQGVDLSKEQLEDIFKIADDFYQGQEYILISHRKNEYSINPLVAKALQLKSAIKNVAVVAYRDNTVRNVKIEKAVFQTDMNLFSNLDDAISWACNY